ncbi:unnamed protein product [Ilex paraguariensis]|uniref:Beta-galactosidase n=1 Tax=Ilex paraguariensis TaxID=185542 RepID=A0ABC8UAC0_9AQUA
MCFMIENEYGPQGKALGAAGHQYMTWAANLAVGLGTRVPWIENEYGPQGKALGAAGHQYMTWAANLAVGLGTGVPWVMCKEEDAPDLVNSWRDGLHTSITSQYFPGINNHIALYTANTYYRNLVSNYVIYVWILSQGEGMKGKVL